MSLVNLTTRKQVRSVRNLSFCYICGEPFDAEEVANFDHVPPETIFVEQDRDFPLKLKTHKDPCHSNLNLDDEVIGQLVSFIHGKQPPVRNDKLKIDLYKEAENNNFLASFSQKPLEPLIFRWVKGFHAALYHTHIPESTRYNIQTPWPSAVIKDNNLVEDPIKNQHYVFVENIKRNRVAGNLDRIGTNNGKLIYECVWDRLSDNSWFCVFALNLYDWKDLGDVNNFQSRGCAGCYRLPSGLAPLNASLATNLHFDIKNVDKADPFSL